MATTWARKGYLKGVADILGETDERRDRDNFARENGKRISQKSLRWWTESTQKG